MGSHEKGSQNSLSCISLLGTGEWPGKKKTLVQEGSEGKLMGAQYQKNAQFHCKGLTRKELLCVTNIFCVARSSL